MGGGGEGGGGSDCVLCVGVGDPTGRKDDGRVIKAGAVPLQKVPSSFQY